MLTYSYDLVRGVGLWLMQGPTAGADEVDRYLKSLLDLDRRMAKRSTIAFIVIENDYPPPNAAARKRIADATAHIESNAVMMLVSPSIIMRSVVTAVNWLRPAPYDVAVEATFEAGVAWLEKHRPAIPPKVYRELLLEARMASAAASVAARTGT